MSPSIPLACTSLRVSEQRSPVRKATDGGQFLTNQNEHSEHRTRDFAKLAAIIWHANVSPLLTPGVALTLYVKPRKHSPNH
jgi:hypothetical protein